MVEMQGLFSDKKIATLTMFARNDAMLSKNTLLHPCGAPPLT